MALLRIGIPLGAVTKPENEPPGLPDEKQAIEFGWRVHGALDAWTGKVDTKASIALAIESAAFAFAVSLTKTGERFYSLSGGDLTWLRIGLVALLLSILLSVFVVFPQLNRAKSKKNWRSNTIYFGHLRHWDAADLSSVLGRDEPQRDQLATQLVAMSKIAWRKHSALQASLLAFVVGIAALVVLELR